MKKFNHKKRGYNKKYLSDKVRQHYTKDKESKNKYDVNKGPDMDRLMRSFSGRVVRARRDEHIESLIKRFRKVVESAGILKEIKKREFAMSKSQKVKHKKKLAIKRARKRLKYSNNNYKNNRD